VRKEPFIVPGFAVYAMSEDRNHIFVGFPVKVMHLVPLVEDVCHQIRRWRIDNGRGDDIGDVAEVVVLCDAELRVRIELPDSREMDITA